jgi:hypothetical protein
MQTTIQLKRQQLRVTAETANSEQQHELCACLLGIAPGYANYQKCTSRDIPMALLHSIGERAEQRSA